MFEVSLVVMLLNHISRHVMSLVLETSPKNLANGDMVDDVI